MASENKWMGLEQQDERDWHEELYGGQVFG